MARSFSSGSSEYLELASALVSTPPWTFCAWINPASTGSSMSIASIATSGSSNHLYRMEVAVAAILRFRARDTGSSDALSTNTVSSGTWYFTAYRATATNNRKVFLDSDSGTSGTTRTPTGMNRTAIGRSSESSGTSYFDGIIALPCFWSISLSDAEIASLAAGAWPEDVQGGSLVDLWYLDGSSPEVGVNGTSLTVNGSTYTSSEPPAVTFPSVGGATGYLNMPLLGVG